jgi:hypothetical protein
MGCPVGELSTLSRSPKQKMNVMPTMSSMTAFPATDQSTTRGIVLDASLVSSDM